MPSTRTSGFPTALRRRWWLVGAGAALGAAVGGAVFGLLPRTYEATTEVLVAPVPGQSVSDPVNLATEAQLVRSSQTVAAAAVLLGGTADASPDAVSVQVLAGSSVLVIRFDAATPGGAQAGARAYAQAYLANRTQLARASIADQLTALNATIGQTNLGLADVNKKIASLPASSPEQATLRTSRTTLAGQLAALTTRVNNLATAPVTPGRVIGDAGLPAAPVRPNRTLSIAWGAALGAIAGTVAAAAGDRLTRRVRRADEVARYAEIGVLAELTGDLSGARALAPRVFAPQHAPGRAFHRLRNEVAASLGPQDKVILVTGASAGAASTIVAANLATALARADNDVVLVGANVPELGTGIIPMSAVFDVADVPGLTDVLTRRTTLAAALQRAPRVPRLRIVASGGTASAGGLLQSEAARFTIRALRDQARYVVVEAPSPASGADAQSLAGLADAAILVVEAGRARPAQVADAATQLRRVGTRMLGAVLVARLAEPGPVLDEDEYTRDDHTWASTVDSPTMVTPPVPAPPTTAPGHAAARPRADQAPH